MRLCVKRFHELTLDELYRLLRLRVAVFVVEQGCPYMELDDRDQEAVHIWLEDAEGIQAYLRVMDRGVESEHVSIGRVISVKRRGGVGSSLLEEGIRVARGVFNAESVYLEAQAYARSFYERQGFRQISEEYVDDGIPHIKMLLRIDEG